ncbi:MAG: NlpC/P60 family protein [Romboutsia timonensis]
MTDLYLCACPELDINHNHTPLFKSGTTQWKWFSNKCKEVVKDNSYQRVGQNIKLFKNVTDCKFFDYLISVEEKEKKYYYYFIVDKQYINEHTTLLVLVLDVIQTYMFDYQLTNCYVERRHCAKKDTSPYLYEEQLFTGEYYVKDKVELYDYTTKGGYIITSSDRLGIKTGSGTGGSAGGDTSSTAMGNVSEEIFVFLKGYEAFSAVPYDDGNGTLTIGYGITPSSGYYNSLCPVCTEEQASNVMYRALKDNYYDSIWIAINGKRTNPKQNEVDAFVSLAYNCGVYGATSSPMFQAYIENQSIEDFANSWLTYNINPGTSTEQGLRNRRQAEYDIFVNNHYDFKPIAVLGGGVVEENNGKGYIPEEIRQSASNQLRLNIVNSAKKLIDKPYRFGGNYPPLGESDGTDCSGLCQWAYNDNGLSIPRTTYDQINQGKQVYLSQLKPGDLVFSYFSSPGVPEHVFMYAGMEDGKHMCVEAQQEGTNIMLREFTPGTDYQYRSLL